MKEYRFRYTETTGAPSLPGLVWRAALMLAACVVAGIVLMTAVQCIPVEVPRANVADDAGMYVVEGTHPRWDANPRPTFTTLDNWTTMYMLEEAILPNDGSALRAAMLNDRVATSVTTNTGGMDGSGSIQP